MIPAANSNLGIGLNSFKFEWEEKQAAVRINKSKIKFDWNYAGFTQSFLPLLSEAKLMPKFGRGIKFSPLFLRFYFACCFLLRLGLNQSSSLIPIPLIHQIYLLAAEKKIELGLRPEFGIIPASL